MASSRQLLLAIMTAVSLSVGSCGGGGGGGGGGDDGGGGGGGGGGSGPGLTVALQQGTYWEFYWEAESTTSTASGTSYDNEAGRYTVTLGVPVGVAGTSLYPLVVTGKPGFSGTDFAPRWTHVGYVNGALVGSTDGETLKTIVNADDASMVGGGFIANFGSETIGLRSGTYSGSYNTLSAVVASHGSSKGGCESILGTTVCSDSKTTFSETEYYKDGIGPLGLHRAMSYSSTSGNFASDHLITQDVELIRTSLTPTDGSTIHQPPWNEVASLNTPRRQHCGAAYGGKIYIFGGATANGTLTTSTEIYDPTTDTWTPGAPLPVTMLDAVAKTVGNKVYLIPTAGTAIRIYDPDSNTWATGPAMGFNDPSVDGDIWTDSGGTYIVTATPNGYLSNKMQIYEYRPSDHSLWTGTALAPYTDHRWGAVTVAGNNLYVIGGYRQNYSSKVYGNTLRYDLGAATWAQSVGALNTPRYCAKAVTLDGEVIVLGGEDVVRELRDVEAYSETTRTWRVLPSMFNARSHFAAVVVNGKVYVVGGVSGGTTLGSVEVYTP